MVVQWVMDPMLPLLQLRSLSRCSFDPRPAKWVKDPALLQWRHRSQPVPRPGTSILGGWRMEKKDG